MTRCDVCGNPIRQIGGGPWLHEPPYDPFVPPIHAPVAQRSELERLRQWKAEAITVLDEWETVWIDAGKPGRLGQSKAVAVSELLRSRCSDSSAGQDVAS
jgi:hypothetical protein